MHSYPYSPRELCLLGRLTPYSDAKHILISGELPHPWYITRGAKGKLYELSGNTRSARSESRYWFTLHGLIRFVDNQAQWTPKGQEYRDRVRTAGYTGGLNDPAHDQFPEVDKPVFPASMRENLQANCSLKYLVDRFEFM